MPAERARVLTRDDQDDLVLALTRRFMAAMDGARAPAEAAEAEADAIAAAFRAARVVLDVGAMRAAIAAMQAMGQRRRGGG